eukprot:403341966
MYSSTSRLLTQLLLVIAMSSFIHAYDFERLNIPSLTSKILELKVDQTNWPKVNVPHEFEAVAKMYRWDQTSKKLQDQKSFGITKMSSKLNLIYQSWVSVKKDGSNQTDSITMKNQTSQVQYYYDTTQSNPCGEKLMTDNRTVQEIIDQWFDPNWTKNFAYAGQDFADWDKTQKYNRINVFDPAQGVGVSYFYTIDTGDMRYIAEYASAVTVYDFSLGFKASNLTKSDFGINECITKHLEISFLQ